jgi:hypothetical protein
LALSLFFGIILGVVASAALAGLVLRLYLDSQAKSKMHLCEPQLEPSGKKQASRSKIRQGAARIATITVMIGLGLLAILPIVALVKVSIIESKVRNKVQQSVDIKSPVLAEMVQSEYERLLNEYR